MSAHRILYKPKEKRCEFYTPPHIIEAARSVMGSIDLDPASCEEANKIVKAKVYYTKEDDGLTKDWFGNVWLNPPFNAGVISKFIEKVQYEAVYYDRLIMITNNSTETKWAQKLLTFSEMTCFLKGRTSFLDKDLNKMKTPLQGQMVIAQGSLISLEKFEKVFGKLGYIAI